MKIKIRGVDVPVACSTCKHVNGFACRAFPGGIPLPIASGDVGHDVPFPGDGGIRWEASREAVTMYRPARATRR